ncbi:MAG: hypothetical protein L0K86_28490, partial [Actinomycetia bacterium]|nr:hypothetical protein [Actinomycetes bacterium]
MSDELQLPDEITVDTLLALSDDTLARLNQSTEGLSTHQRASFEHAMTALTKQFSQAVTRSGLSPAARNEIAQIANDRTYPKALRNRLQKLAYEHSAQQRRLFDQLRLTDLPRQDTELSNAIAAHEDSGPQAGAPPQPTSTPPASTPPGTPTSPSAPSQPPRARTTAGQIRDGLEELEEEKSELSELVSLHQSKQESDRRLEALFWIVSAAAIVQGVSTVVAADSGAQRWTTIAVSAVL